MKNDRFDKGQGIDCLNITLVNFEKHFDRLKQSNTIEGRIIHADAVICDDSIPVAVRTIYNAIYSIEITKPHFFKLFPLSVQNLQTKRWVRCADVGGHSLYFDTACLNEAGEFDIVNLENNYVVTKTLASLLTNKTWAWVERNRKIWMEETGS